ncbi:hypothetical protein E2C01_004759 [Portunus trituberculatus]|uniref:Uncharacterized protein n=1 Tax=Portunus trituberculatus TaxID=210409 RepID=A0A5B7CRJ9_PORTR|nr:hypothetical protein [Portunus trituberculatus]
MVNKDCHLMTSDCHDLLKASEPLGWSDKFGEDLLYHHLLSHASACRFSHRLTVHTIPHHTVEQRKPPYTERCSIGALPTLVRTIIAILVAAVKHHDG